MSRLLMAAGLFALATLLTMPPTAAGLIGAAPLATLAIGVLATVRNSGRWVMVVAILMLPYFSFGVMEMISNPGNQTQAVVFSVLTVGVFLTALDCARRR